MTLDWESLYVEHAAELAGYAAKLVGDHEVGSDLTQEAFIRGIRSNSAIRDPAAMRAWLFRTATNLAYSHRRRQRILAFLPFSGRELAPRTAFDIEADQVRLALRSIPAEQAAALLLFYDNGFARAEVATLLGVSEEAVKSRLARGRRNFIAAYRRLERGLAR